jgi:predicted lipid-binding transport protein (Tim44 family)
MTRRSAAALLLSLLIILAPSFAEARAGGSYRLGGGSSFTSQGSRGFNTYGFNGAAPIQRSVTPQSGGAYGYQPGYGYGYGYRHPFLTGLFGGFFGSWLGGMLFPHWGMGWGFGGMIGSVFAWLILLGLVWFLIRLFAGRGSMMSFGGGSMFGGMPYGPYGGSPMGGAMGFGPQPMNPGYGAPRPTTIGVTGADYQEFEAILKEVQTAWSRGDLAALRRHVTPEMLSYFAEQLAENQSQGVINHVDDVELIKGEVREAWDEGNLQYATALLHWRARDYTVSIESKPGQGELVVGGDPQHASEASEMWTFARSPGGHWLLSAIQQMS